MGLVIFILVSLGSVWGIGKLYRWNKSDSYNDDWNSDDGMYLIFGYIFTGVMLIASIIGFMTLLDRIIGLLINPEYYAIQELLNLVKY